MTGSLLNLWLHSNTVKVSFKETILAFQYNRLDNIYTKHAKQRHILTLFIVTSRSTLQSGGILWIVETSRQKRLNKINQRFPKAM